MGTAEGILDPVRSRKAITAADVRFRGQSGHRL